MRRPPAVGALLIGGGSTAEVDTAAVTVAPSRANQASKKDHRPVKLDGGLGDSYTPRDSNPEPTD